MRRPSEVHIFGSLDWQRDQRHKRFRPSGCVHRRRIYSSKAHDAAMEQDHANEAAKALENEILFCADVTDIRFLKLIYNQAHPRANFGG